MNPRDTHDMKEKPLVSIVTPSFNQSRYLEETIQSVLSQTYPNLEYLVIDGGSTDGSVDIIQRYAAELAYWVSEPDRGQSDALNKGFQIARGDVLAWLNADDIYYPTAVQEAVEYLVAHPGIGLVYGDCDLIDEKGQKIGQFDARQTNYHRLMQGRGNIPQPAAFWQRSLWDRLGPLDTSFQFAMDYDLWLRFARASEIRYVPQRWAGFRMHEGTKTSQIFERCWPEMKKAHQKQGGWVVSIFTWRYMLRKYLGSTWRWMRGVWSRS